MLADVRETALRCLSHSLCQLSEQLNGQSYRRKLTSASGKCVILLDLGSPEK